MKHSMSIRLMASAVALLMTSGLAGAGEYEVKSAPRTEYKSVFGQVQSRDIVPARARIGGTVVSLDVEEGSAVKAGDVLATVVDDKLALQLSAADARIKQIEAQLANAKTELNRGKTLLSSGTIPKSRLEALQTQTDVVANQLAAAESDRAVILQQGTEGKVLAPATGRVLTVPVTQGSVIMPGEPVARIAGGGYFLRLSLPERHAAHIKVGDEVLVGSRGLDPAQSTLQTARKGKLIKIYPEIEGGRVLADVEVDGLGDFFAGERTLVWIPVGVQQVLAVPPEALQTRFGVDYVKIATAAGAIDVPVIIGEKFDAAEGPRVQVLSGLRAGDKVETP